MKVWLTCFLVLFAIAELYQWITDTGWIGHVSLPLPALMLAGAGLAIASNYDKRAGLPWQMQKRSMKSPATPTVPSTPSEMPSKAPQPAQPQPQPVFTPNQERSISFTIQKPSSPQS